MFNNLRMTPVFKILTDQKIQFGTKNILFVNTLDIMHVLLIMAMFML